MAERKYAVLLVDDDKFLLDMYSLKFTQQGLTVDSAFGGEEALRKLREGARPDILLLDIVMPGIDGFGVLEAIKKEKLAEGVTKIVLSNQGQEAEIERAKSLGIDGYIIKASAIPSEVLSQILDIVKRRRA